MKRLAATAVHVVLALVVACKSNKADDTATVASGSGSNVAAIGSGSGVRGGSGSGSGSSAAAPPVDDGEAPGAIWLTADLLYTDAGGKPQITRVVELLDGAKGWKIATASIATVKPPKSPATGEAPAMPAPTEPGPLTKQLGAPKELGAALAGAADAPGAGPAAVVVGWEQ